ncbi:DHH family phosphoesterase [Halorubrum vacuolatum]|uniref:NanoRNase/pAp phosphatase, hydrolyzes c-di-AMP and oligoRNAs n=1 Tax=Halorubrum vacuolatum TaxID=63740 RepID=A0A238WGV1_HALVU|nr:bifunctional oligoribonuclease/PAP phosphatase NrnA [Halorubrum vacuolatum]SNR45800.1 nanoRNase/pAp phosphatase, hydrolyzes c-di-AMP and oligoRNAs [Halorubrum vacuolatum]
MLRRLLLGCSSVGYALVERVREAPGELYAVTDDTGWTSTLRDENVVTAEADPTDPSVYPDAADVVLIADADPARNVAAAAAARRRYPNAMIVAHVGTAPRPEHRDALRATADRLLDPAEALEARVLHAVDDDSGNRPVRLLETLRDLSGPLLIVAHDNPDPDAIASAFGLARIAEAVGVPADRVHGGEIAHQENRALVNLLDLDLRTFDDVVVDEYDGIALVDHSRAGINDGLPEGTPVDIVIDHHPPRGPVAGRFIDVRPALGSTSTLIQEYLSRLAIEPDERLATALLYGIRIDTKDLTRETTPQDIEAAAELVPFADESVLRRVESPSVTPETLRVLARAIERRDVRGSIVASCVGEIGDRDALAQAAERLLDIEDVTVTFVYGYMDGTIFGSARSRGADVDVGELLREALDPIGSAGGHANMAGAQVPLGILSDVAADESLPEVVAEAISERFFEAVRDPPAAPTGADSPFSTE